MKKSCLTLYYDALSVHSWIMFEKLNSLNLRLDVTLNFIPVHASTIVTSSGNKVPYYTASLKKNFFSDTRFLGKYNNISIKTPWQDIDNLLLNSANSLIPQYFLTMVAKNYPEKLVQCSRLMWKMLWVDNRSIHTDENIYEIIKELQLPYSCLNLLSDEKWSKILFKNQNNALISGCFGLPWITINNLKKIVSYYGCDCLPLILNNLKKNL